MNNIILHISLLSSLWQKNTQEKYITFEFISVNKNMLYISF